MIAMKRNVALLLSVLIMNSAFGQEKSYEPDWQSLKKHKTPEWFRDAKFGIYCHWGPYSVPAFENEWYSHWMYTHPDNPGHGQGKEFYEHHIQTYAPLDEFGYKDFIPMFTAEKFDATEWAELFEKAGAKFAGPVSEHADGFAMWDSDLTKWDAKEMGPSGISWRNFPRKSGNAT